MRIPSIRQIDRDDWLIEQSRGQKVLHVGCTDSPITEERLSEGRLLHQKLVGVTESCVGMDIDEISLLKVRRSMPEHEFICHDAEMLGQCDQLGGRKFSRIIAADVLEHLSNPGLFLDGSRLLLEDEGRIVVTAPHAFSVKRLTAMMLLRREHVHPDHTAYYSLSTLSCIGRRYCLDIESFVGFQWWNPTLQNRLAYYMTLPFMMASGGRVCDELGVVFVKK